MGESVPSSRILNTSMLFVKRSVTATTDCWTDGNGGCARGVRAKKSDRVINWTELIPFKMEAHNVAAASRIQDLNEVAVLCDRVWFAAERRHLIGKRERGTLNPKYRDLAASSIYGEKQRVVFT